MGEPWVPPTKLNIFLFHVFYNNSRRLRIAKLQSKFQLNFRKMSLITAYICLFKKNVPVDVANAVIEYTGANSNSRWIPRFNLCGKLCWTVNKEAFNRLSEICTYKPAISRNFRQTPFTVIINGVEQEKQCSNVLLIAPKIVSLDTITIRSTVYVSIEVAPNVYNHMSLLCDWSVGEVSGVTTFYKGSLYRPNERFRWDQEQTITTANINGGIISIDHVEGILQFTPSIHPEWSQGKASYII